MNKWHGRLAGVAPMLKGDSHCREVLSNQLIPFLLQRSLKHDGPRAAVPVAGVGCIAFLAMQIRMQAVVGSGALFALSDVVGHFPVAFGIMPKGLENRVQPNRRLGVFQGCGKVGEMDFPTNGGRCGGQDKMPAEGANHGTTEISKRVQNLSGPIGQ